MRKIEQYRAREGLITTSDAVRRLLLLALRQIERED